MKSKKTQIEESVKNYLSTVKEGIIDPSEIVYTVNGESFKYETYGYQSGNFYYDRIVYEYLTRHHELVQNGNKRTTGLLIDTLNGNKKVLIINSSTKNVHSSKI